MEPILELREITKTFGAKVANDAVSLSVLPGRVHAIVGENGAGKTTLMNMISGNTQPDSGVILFDGTPVTIADPHAADALGIGMVHQHFKLVPSLSVAANVHLGREVVGLIGRLDTRSMEQRVVSLATEFGLQIQPRDRVENLSVGQRQRVEILKALSHDTRLLILDEPTAVLTPAETDELFVVIRRLAVNGCAVVFISHKLGEVLSIADDVTVIRDGSVVGTRSVEGLAQSDLASMMVGREVLLRVHHAAARLGEVVLSVDEVRAVDRRGVVAVDGVTLQVARGEVVGVAGVEGNGQSELAAAIAGTALSAEGRITLRGVHVSAATVARRRSLGFAYIPEDRYEEGVAPSLTVAQNVAATHLRPPIARYGWLSMAGMRRFAQTLIDRFDVRGAGPDSVIATLSGGNMQKLVIAREFESRPAVLMIAQPTRGVDVGAMEFVHRSILDARDAGAGILLFSADLTEVMSLSDRLLVMHRGRIQHEFARDQFDEVAIGLAMAGTRPTAEALAEARARRAAVEEQLEATGAGLVSEVAPDDWVETPSESTAKPMQAERPQLAAARSGVRRALDGLGQPVFALGAALAFGAMLILALGHNPVTAYVALFTSGWSTSYGIGSIVAMFVPLAIMSAGTIVSFRAGFFNVGGEGQLFFGAFFGAVTGYTFTTLPAPLHIVLVLAAGVFAGALWGLIPGILYAVWRVDIVVVTLLLSQVAVLVTNFFVTGPFQDKSAGMPASKVVDPDVRLPFLSPVLGIGLDLPIALVLAAGVALLLERSVWGLRVKQIGQANGFARYTGVSVGSMSVQVLALSGAIAGFAGALFVIGPSGGRFLQAFSPGFGFLAITVALLARLNPWASLLAALFYSTMLAGGTGLQMTGVPFPLVNVLQGLIIIAVTATFVLRRSHRRKQQGAMSDVVLPQEMPAR